MKHPDQAMTPPAQGFPPMGKPPMGMPPMGRPPMHMSLGELLSRPPKGVPFVDRKPPMQARQGAAKPWLAWTDGQATVSDVDTFVLMYLRRMKPCTAFDKLDMDSGENQEFGDAGKDFVHFNPMIGDVIGSLAQDFPEEAARYQAAYTLCMNEELATRIRLLNPMNFIGTTEKSTQAKHYRIRAGARDADTSLSISMTLALKLANAGCGTVDYAIVWDQPHSEADYPGEVLDWIDRIG